MLLMLIAHPIRTFAAWAAIELGSVIAFMCSVFAFFDPATQAILHDPNIAANVNPIGLTPQAMMIAAYTSLVTAIFGGVVAVVQVIVTARNAKNTKENEVLRMQTQLQAQQIALLSGWQRTILNQKPGENYQDGPTFNPDPNTSTPQAMEHAKSLPVFVTTGEGYISKPDSPVTPPIPIVVPEGQIVSVPMSAITPSVELSGGNSKPVDSKPVN